MYFEFYSHRIIYLKQLTRPYRSNDSYLYDMFSRLELKALSEHPMAYLR
jgi:hypothetical protein